MLRRAIRTLCQGEQNQELSEVLVNNAARAFDWFRNQGVRTVQFGGALFPGRRVLLVPPPALRPGLHWPGRGADSMMRRMAERLSRNTGRLLLGMRASDLILERGRCVGVNAQQAGCRHAFRATAVLIADGGFQANHDLVRRYISPRPERLLQRNAGTGTGDGLQMGKAAGAVLNGMDRFYGHVQSRDAMSNPRLWPYPTVDFPIAAGIAVDAQGRRFADEGLGGIYMANAIAALGDPLEATAIFDSAIWEGRARTFLVPSNPNLERAGATIHRAASLKELAGLAGLPADNLTDTVERFNAAVANGTTRQLVPTRTSSPLEPARIGTPPFYAVPLCAGITYTMGGLAIDSRCRVKHRDGGIIEGLFAAGAAAGGLEGGRTAAYMGGLSKALIQGFVAAEEISAQAQNARTRSQSLEGQMT
ncbi:MAG: FAD-binding protein [Pseudorhodoplanes sp.]